jgi:hypothetical protein
MSERKHEWDRNGEMALFIRMRTIMKTKLPHRTISHDFVSLVREE